MKVKFKKNTEPCLQYDVINPEIVMHYDEFHKKYMPCIEISVLGMVPAELLTETHHPDNVDGINVAVYLSTH